MRRGVAVECGGSDDLAQEVLGPLVLGLVESLGRRALFDDLAASSKTTRSTVSWAQPISPVTTARVVRMGSKSPMKAMT
ncbi:hypothetical protein [Streptomyces sp. NPDC060002]|uniref:hypothetical protein n=1 Tax=Streptomyces sp. NPDC060002 TaxID=3347033 RepID=UPI0036755405